MRPVDGLPDPRGQLSLTLPSSSIVEANRLVQEVTKEAAKQKRGPYKTYSPTVRSEIGKYACQHGVASAARVFSRRLEKTVSGPRTHSFFLNSAAIFPSSQLSRWSIFVAANFRGWLQPRKFNPRNISPSKISAYTVCVVVPCKVQVENSQLQLLICTRETLTGWIYKLT